MEVLKDQKKIKKIAEDIFGEERVDIVDKVDAHRFSIIIHFPVLDITNSFRAKHTMYDLWVRFPVNLNAGGGSGGYQIHVGFTGRRSTVSLKEAQAGYGHSHLNRSSAFTDWTNFCLGNSNFLNILENLKLNGTEEDWEFMFLSLTPFLAWESLEGGPYIQITNIQYTDGRGRSTNHATQVSQTALLQELCRILPMLPKHVWTFTPELTLINHHPDVFAFFNKYSKIRKLTIASSPNGRTIADLRSSEEAWNSSMNTYITFKGKLINFRVFDESIEAGVLKSNSETIDRDVVNAYITILENHSINKVKQFQYESIKAVRQPILRAIGAAQ